MKKAFSKYFVISLSLLLILSNFSYATQLMLCEMTGDTKACECKDNDAKKYNGISLNNVESKCCNEETTVLSNQNTLLPLNKELNNDINSDLTIFLNNSYYLNYHNISSRTSSLDKSHLPELDILIFTSSLLI